MKKIVFVTAPKVFRDEEYAEPKAILEQAGIKVVTASTVVGEIYGKIKIKAQSEILISDVCADDFDAVFFVGGAGCSIYFNDPLIHKLAWDFYKAEKIVSAICIAPTILANAGILKCKKATVFHDGIEALVNGGAVYTGKDVEVDGTIVTGDGPQSAKLFAQQLIKFLS